MCKFPGIYYKQLPILLWARPLSLINKTNRFNQLATGKFKHDQGYQLQPVLSYSVWLIYVQRCVHILPYSQLKSNALSMSVFGGQSCYYFSHICPCCMIPYKFKAFSANKGIYAEMKITVGHRPFSIYYFSPMANHLPPCQLQAIWPSIDTLDRLTARHMLY